MDVRANFPLLKKNADLVYLDSAATTQKPQTVIDAMNDFYAKHNSNAGRGLYGLADAATRTYEDARETVGQFIGAKSSEIVFTSSATASLNMLSRMLPDLLNDERDEVVVTAMEHHSNFLPWRTMCERHGFRLRVIPATREGINLDELSHYVSSRTAVVCCAHISNVLGVETDVARVCSLARKVGALSVIDCAQSVATVAIDISKIGCDFLVFSAHKMYGPMGVGVLFGRFELLVRMSPVSVGGGMVDYVSVDEVVYRDVPYRFEAGSVNVAGAVGLASAIRYLNTLGLDNVHLYKQSLTDYCLERLRELGIDAFGANGIVSFHIDGVHAHDIASLLDDSSVCVRAGTMCAMPLLDSLNLQDLVRVSFGVYSSRDDVDRLIVALHDILRRFNYVK